MRETCFTEPPRHAGGSLLNSTANYSIDFAPDIILKVAADPGFGHYEVYGLARGFRDRSPATAAGINNTTWAGSRGAGMILPLVSNVLEFQASGLYGAGNGRYGSVQLPDATIKPDGSVAAIREWQAMGGFVLKPTPQLTVYIYAGVGLQYSYLDRKTFSGVGGDPSTNISMGFVSFRYYPYQR